MIARSFLAAILIIAACPARGEDVSCADIPDLSAASVLSLGHISTAAERIHFIKDALGHPGCPNMTPACLDRAYLVSGDRVIITAERPDFVCATYINAKGEDRPGWLPSVAVARDRSEAVTPAGWLGKWSRVEADITVKAEKARVLHIEGNATFGAWDPDRVKRGAVNTGEIEGDVTPAGDRLSFAVGESATLPVDQGDEFACKVWMQRIGPWLVVYDNRNCGGRNVTFRGFYTRRP